MPRRMLVTVMTTILVVLALVLLSVVVMASQEIVSSGFKKGTHLKVGAVLYKDTGELDWKYDYYAVRMTVEDLTWRNDWWVGPMYAYVYIYLPSNAQEVIAAHLPIAGWQGTSQIRTGFGFMGISFNVQLPAYGVSYYAWYEGSFLKIRWDLTGATGPVGWWFVFEDYADFSIGFRVPAGSKPFAYAGAWVYWYRFNVLWFSYETREGVFWAYVSATSMTTTATVARDALVMDGVFVEPSVPPPRDVPLTLERGGDGGTVRRR